MLTLWVSSLYSCFYFSSALDITILLVTDDEDEDEDELVLWVDMTSTAPRNALKYSGGV